MSSFFVGVANKLESLSKINNFDVISSMLYYLNEPIKNDK